MTYLEAKARVRELANGKAFCLTYAELEHQSLNQSAGQNKGAYCALYSLRDINVSYFVCIQYLAVARKRVTVDGGYVVVCGHDFDLVVDNFLPTCGGCSKIIKVWLTLLSWPYWGHLNMVERLVMAREMKMTKRQKEKAAKLWGLALIVHCGERIEETEKENDIRSLAKDQAENALARLGYSASQLLCADDCIRAVAP